MSIKGYVDRFCRTCNTYTLQRVLVPRYKWQCLNCDGVSTRHRPTKTKQSAVTRA